MSIRRINLFGGPGCGKSTMAANVFAYLKKQGTEIELVDEYVKSWAWEGREVNPFDQVYLFAKQMRKEYLVLSSSSNMIITDSPLCLSIAYGKKYKFKNWQQLQIIANKFEQEFPSLNFFLVRDGCEYKHDGRFETYEEALEVDRLIMSHMDEQGIEYSSVNFDDVETVIDVIVSKS